MTLRTTDLSAEMKTFYERELLERAVATFVHEGFGQQRPLPTGEGKTVEFRKFGALSAATTPLTEGVTPVPDTASVTTLTATIASYGKHIEGSDTLVYTAFDPILNELVMMQGEQAGETLDTVTRDILVAGTTVQYAAGRVGRSSVAAGDLFTSTELRKALRTLANNKAKRINGSWVSIIDPYTKYDIQSDSKWEAADNYAGAQRQHDGEVGMLYGTRFVETTQAKVFTGAGSGGIDVHATVILGANAYGVIPLQAQGHSSNQSLKYFFKPIGSAGSADPLDQRWTSGWKVAGFTALILQQLYMIRVEHAVST